MQIKITTGRMTQFVSAIIAATGMVKTTSDPTEARNFYEQSGKRALKLVKKTFKKSTVEALAVPHAPRGRAISASSNGTTITAKRGRPPGKRGPGRPKGSTNKPKATGRRGRPPGSKTRIGKKPGYSINGIKLGRPASTNKKAKPAKASGKRRGRPPGKRGPGRPKGSKNKPKAVVKKVAPKVKAKAAPKATPKAKAKPRKAKAAPAAIAPVAATPAQTPSADA